MTSLGAPAPGFPSGRALSLTAAVAQFGIFWMGYRFLPGMPVRWRDAWPGALLAVILWQLTGYVLGVYLSSIPTYALLYNRLGAVLALLTWVYALACTFLFGAEFVAQWISLRRGAPPKERIAQLHGRPGRMVDRCQPVPVPLHAPLDNREVQVLQPQRNLPRPAVADRIVIH